ncbi:MAG: class SAM-dependent methyltransferase [Conexibacter sp.]|nr:class SAM-dependent methyltransferase [Conexibacter sp.]
MACCGLVDVVYDFDPEQAFERLESWCPTGADDSTAGWARAELEEHVRDEHSTYTWLLEPMIRRAGFAIEEAIHSDDSIVASYVLRAG